MAVQWISQGADGSGVGLDVDESDRVVAIVVVNNSDTTFWVEVERTRGNKEREIEAPPGTNRRINLPPSRHFRYADEVLADWTVNVRI